MTATELISFELDHVGKQLKKVFEGMNEEHLDHKVCEGTMSPRETVEHLCECYQAFMTESQGGVHEWGSFSIADKSWDNLLSQFDTYRERAMKVAKSSDQSRILRAASDYMILHDAYHVGAMASCRLQADPSWDSMSIYR